MAKGEGEDVRSVIVGLSSYLLDYWVTGRDSLERDEGGKKQKKLVTSLNNSSRLSSPS